MRLEDGTQCSLQLRILKGVSIFQCAPGHDPLAVEHEVGHFAQRQAQGKRRSGQKRGPSNHISQDPGEFAIGYLMRGSGIDRAGNIFVGQGETDQANDVEPMNP